MDETRYTIFYVDDDKTNLQIGRHILSGVYNVFSMDSAAKLMKMLERQIPDLILLDVEMPEMNGYEVIQIIKSNPHYSEIPVIFLTAKSDSDNEMEGLSLGAIDYIIKPYSPPLLLKRIEVHLLVEQQKKELREYSTNLERMVLDKTKTVIELKNAVLKTMGELVECRDDITGAHIERTSIYLDIMLTKMEELGVYKEEISKWNKNLVIQSAQLHDVGKIAVRDNVLLKPGKLTEEEFKQIQEHPLFGERVIDKIGQYTTDRDFLEHAKIFSGAHHEKWDGSGYPRGLSGRDIPLQGRLMAICDVYDALISDRPYKKGYQHEVSVEIMESMSGTHFDPTLVEVFMKVERQFEQVYMSMR